MKQIKTIQRRRDHWKDFDREVNDAIRDGWELKDRFLAPGYANSSMDFHPVHVAYLEREVPDDE